MTSYPLLFALCSLLFTSCNIFETRSTEPPNETRTHFVTPITDSLVIENLKYAIEERNTENYLKCFSDTAHRGAVFTFIPSQDVSSQYRIFDEWNLHSERKFFDRLRISTMMNTPSALLLATRNKTEASDSVLLTADYTVSFVHNQNFSREARGLVEFIITRNLTNGLWGIRRWSDFKTDSSHTWSYWKARFSQ
jgi:hypothetical protein